MRLVTFFKLLLLLVIGGGAYEYWQEHKAAGGTLSSVFGDDAAVVASAGGFVPVPTPDGMSPHGVVVFAPENCPSDEAQRAYALISDLGGRGVPVVRASAASFDNLPDAATAERVRAVMSGQIPIVFVNGRAKGNSSLEDVLAEYRRKTSG